ncbi:hypothetical protein EVAR_32994_1 [Eumeta japonica]|uniref:Uncharacterized protein n=1 Tax=Eumeta variegata TaxID=151549 RepID=A0A4C1VQ63_EUMVA|nr:hypothetical protein EVAR_32994_1 [Eumeta japonica]
MPSKRHVSAFENAKWPFAKAGSHSTTNLKTISLSINDPFARGPLEVRLRPEKVIHKGSSDDLSYGLDYNGGGSLLKTKHR